jgi:hypothetical protein
MIYLKTASKLNTDRHYKYRQKSSMAIRTMECMSFYSKKYNFMHKLLAHKRSKQDAYIFIKRTQEERAVQCVNVQWGLALQVPSIRLE